MRTRVQRWGNSLGVRISRHYAEETGLAEHSEVEISLADGALLIRPASRSFTLEELLAGVTESNIHGEVAIGRPAGREVW
jgi:antitoxin MazE